MAAHADSTQIGKNIRDMRLRQGLKQFQLGERVGYTDYAVCRHEKGIGLSIETIYTYADGLGCTIDDLLEYHDRKKNAIEDFENTVDSVRELPVDIMVEITSMMKSMIRCAKIS